MQLTNQSPDSELHPLLQADKIMPTGALAQFSWQGSWNNQPEAKVELEQIIRPRALNQAAQTAE